MNKQNSTSIQKPALSCPPVDNKQMVEIFLLYLEERITQDDWIRFIKQSETKKLTVLLPKYGDYIFQDMVNQVSIFFDLPVKLLLLEFARYTKTHEL